MVVGDASLFRAFDKSESGAVIGDGKPERHVALDESHFLRVSAHVREDEVFQTDLAAEQARHVNFVRV